MPSSAPIPWHRFDPPLMLQRGELDRFIDRVFPGRRATAVEFLDRGVVNTNYRVDLAPAPGPTPGRDRVRLRLSRSDEGPRREGAIGERLTAELDVEVPRLLATEWSGPPEPHRRTFFSWIAGRTLDEVVYAGAPAARARPLAAEIGRRLAALHRIGGPAFGRLGSDLSVSTRGAAPPVTRWPDELVRRLTPRLDNPAHGLDPASLPGLRQAVARAMAPLWSGAAIEPALVHGDLSPGNWLVTEDDPPRLAGWIDWEMARFADPAVDLASLRFEMGEYAPDFVAEVEEAYHASRAEGGAGEWERRISLAELPILLDARMVAHRRRSRDLLTRVDRRLAAFVTRWNRAPGSALS